MTDHRIDLEDLAAIAVGEIAAQQKSLDIDSLRDEASDRAHEEADNACIYTHHCLTLLQDYESRPEAPNESDMGGEFRADQWSEAMTAWAYEVAAAVLNSEMSEAVDALEETRDALLAALGEEPSLQDDMPEESDLRVSFDCPHGWAPHDREDADGICYWSEPHLEGCRALAVKDPKTGVWLSYTWTPEPADEDETA